MGDKIFVPSLSALTIYLIELLKTLYSYAPEITFIVQLTIGLLTIIYLIKKIKNFKS